MKNIVFDGVRVLQAENEDLEKYYECKGKQCLLRDALPYQIVCFFEHCSNQGGEQTHVQKILLQILYTSGRYLAP